MTHANRAEGSDDYATPPSVWRPLSRAVGGFNVDPASGVESTPIAETRYTVEENGLEQAWHGDVWLNPPFGDAPSTGPSKRETWLTKARQEARRDDVRTVTCLLPVDTSTRWFHRHVVEAPVLCLMGPGRLEFEGEKPEDTGNTSFATCIAVYGDPPDELVTALEEFGAVFRGREYARSTLQGTLVPDGGEVSGEDRVAPLCEQKFIVEKDGMTITEYTECYNDAIGRFRYVDPHGSEDDFVWCEDHVPDDAELIESFEDRNARHQDTGVDRSGGDE